MIQSSFFLVKTKCSSPLKTFVFKLNFFLKLYFALLQTVVYKNLTILNKF